MATRWFANRKLALGIGLLAISLVISACSNEEPKAPPGLLIESPQARQAGGALFENNCAICHGVNGNGQGRRQEGMNPPPANLTLPPWSDPGSAGKVFLVIRHGVRGTAMPAWPAFSDEQVWDLVAFIVSLKHQ